MSFSLANVALIRGAAQLATGVASRVGQAIRFDDVLHPDSAAEFSAQPSGPSAEASRAEQPSLTQRMGRLADAIRLELAKQSIDLNQPLGLSVQKDGSLRVGGNHPRAAEIEAWLNADGRIRQLATELASASELEQISIDLTSSSELENMVGPGGYPNW